jgi:predicted DNA-binding WGR domain protein
MGDENNRTFSRYAELKAGLNNKFYEVEVEEQPDGTAKWLHRWGRIGTAGAVKPGKSYSFIAAKDLCNEQFKKKLDKGYVEVTAMQIIASAAETVEERPVRGLDPVKILVPNFGAGPSEERCKAFAQKYLDKMNVIRKSKDDLGAKYYDQITDLIESFRDEWDRMKVSKTHGDHIRHQQASDAFKEILIALREFGVLGKSIV